MLSETPVALSETPKTLTEINSVPPETPFVVLLTTKTSTETSPIKKETPDASPELTSMHDQRRAAFFHILYFRDEVFAEEQNREGDP